MKRPLLIAATLILILSVGCASKKISANMASWMGADQSRLILSWGPPDKTDSDGKGGQVLTWLRDRGNKSTTSTTYNTGVKGLGGEDIIVTNTSGGGKREPATRMFWVNEDGIIYNWKWQGL